MRHELREPLNYLVECVVSCKNVLHGLVGVLHVGLLKANRRKLLRKLLNLVPQRVDVGLVRVFLNRLTEVLELATCKTRGKLEKLQKTANSNQANPWAVLMMFQEPTRAQMPCWSREQVSLGLSTISHKHQVDMETPTNPTMTFVERDSGCQSVQVKDALPTSFLTLTAILTALSKQSATLTKSSSTKPLVVNAGVPAP